MKFKYKLLIALLIGMILIFFIPLFPVKLWNVGFTQQSYYWLSGLKALENFSRESFVILEVIGGLGFLLLSYIYFLIFGTKGGN